jgi:hypothetical protein
MSHKQRVARRRSFAGEANPASKLTDDDVRQIRASYTPGTAAALAKQFGVGYGTIWMVLRGVTWTHVK